MVCLGWERVGKKPCCSLASSPNAQICKDLGASASKCQYRPPGMTISCNCLLLQWAVKIKIVQTVSLPFFDLLKALRLGCCSSSLLLGFLDLCKGLMKSTDLLPDERENRRMLLSLLQKLFIWPTFADLLSSPDFLTTLNNSSNSDTSISRYYCNRAHSMPSYSSPVWYGGHCWCRGRQLLEPEEDLPLLGFAV